MQNGLTKVDFVSEPAAKVVERFPTRYTLDMHGTSRGAQSTFASHHQPDRIQITTTGTGRA